MSTKPVAQITGRSTQAESTPLSMAGLSRYDPKTVMTLLLVCIIGFVLSSVTVAIATHLLQRESSSLSQTVKSLSF